MLILLIISNLIFIGISLFVYIYPKFNHVYQSIMNTIEFITDIYDDICRFLWDIWYFIRKIFRFIDRLIYWMPKLWNNEEWDFVYLLEFIVYKLERMKQCQLDDDMHMYSDRKAKQISIVIEHLKRVLNIDNYTVCKYTESKNKRLGKDIDIFEYLRSGLTTFERIHLHDSGKLREWHLSEACRRINKYIFGWWC